MTDRDGLLAGFSPVADDARRWPWLGACAGWLVGAASAGLGSVGGLWLLVVRAFSGRSGRADL